MTTKKPNMSQGDSTAAKPDNLSLTLTQGGTDSRCPLIHKHTKCKIKKITSK